MELGISLAKLANLGKLSIMSEKKAEGWLFNSVT